MNFFNPNTSFTDDIFEAARFKLGWRLSISFAIIFSLLATMFYFIELQGFIIYSIVFVLSIGSLFYLHNSKKSTSSIVIFAFANAFGNAFAGAVVNHFGS